MNLHVDKIQQPPATDKTLTRQGNAALQQTASNSPQVQQLKAYGQMANNSRQVKQLKAYQQMADSAAINRKVIDIPAIQMNAAMQMRKTATPGTPVVQRAVITVNADGLIGDSAQTVANVTNAEAGAFAEVRDDETIYIFAHGYHSLTRPITKDNPTTNLEPMLMGGITAADLCNMMIEEGWREEHTGPIDIRACMSGAESMLPSFAQLFATELKKAGRTNLVTGYKHLTKTEGDGSEVAMKPTISKMIDVAKQSKLGDLTQQFFAVDVTGMYESSYPDLLEQRKKCNLYLRPDQKPLLVGYPPPDLGMTAEEWNVYSYYHAIETGNAALIEALNKDFAQRDYQVNRPVGGAHDRTFDPAEMVLAEEPQDNGISMDDLMARFANLKK